MMAFDAAVGDLDATVDGIAKGASTATDVSTAAELFAVVDVLDGQPMLRRSLSDPTASVDDRLGLCRRLFEGKVSAGTLTVLLEAIKESWNSGTHMVAGLERQGIRLAFLASLQDGDLARVAEEMHDMAVIIDETPELEGTLRKSYPVEAKRSLIDGLIADKVKPVSRMLIDRVVRAPGRNHARSIRRMLEIAADIAGRRVARVTVAKPLDEARIARLTRALEAQAGGPVALQIEVDPSVLGGLHVALGDHVFEATVAARLDHARRQLITS